MGSDGAWDAFSQDEKLLLSCRTRAAAPTILYLNPVVIHAHTCTAAPSNCVMRSGIYYRKRIWQPCCGWEFLVQPRSIRNEYSLRTGQPSRPRSIGSPSAAIRPIRDARGSLEIRLFALLILISRRTLTAIATCSWARWAMARLITHCGQVLCGSRMTARYRMAWVAGSTGCLRGHLP